MHIYLNPSKDPVVVILVSEDHSSITRLDIGSGATMSLTYDGLDRYVPHVLRKIDLLGREIRINAIPVATKVESVEEIKPEIDEVNETVKEVSETVEEVSETAEEVNAPVSKRINKFNKKS